MIISIEVNKNKNENGVGLIRRFTRKVQEARIIQQVKGNRYNSRPLSKLVLKEAKLKRLKKTEEFEKKYKLGKVSKNVKRGRK